MTGNSKSRTPAIVLQDRDRRLLTEVGTMRLIDREMAKVVAGFGSTTRANTRLLKLTRAGLLRQFFVGTIVGGRKGIYTLSPQGAGLVGSHVHGIRRRSGRQLSGDLYAEHQLRISSVFVTVKYGLLSVNGTRFLRWRNFYDPISPSIPLMPDGYFELEMPTGIKAVFLEVDLGTEVQRVWQQKVQHYLRLATSGEFARKFNQPQFRVIVLANSIRRLRGIRATVARETDKIFWFSTFEQTNRDGFWSPIWLRPAGDQMQSLL